jgi:hypothetical protein
MAGRPEQVECVLGVMKRLRIATGPLGRQCQVQADPGLADRVADFAVGGPGREQVRAGFVVIAERDQCTTPSAGGVSTR